MAIHCMQCGTELPDEANFCWKCGRGQKGHSNEPTEAITYEVCEIYRAFAPDNHWYSHKWIFWAKAVGPKGVYSAGSSTHIDVIDGWLVRATDKNATLLNNLIKNLTQDGWEPIGRISEYWYEYKFRRKVKSN